MSLCDRFISKLTAVFSSVLQSFDVCWLDDSTPAVRAVRYAESLTFHIELQPDQSDGLIYPPYVSVKYAVATAEDYLADKNVTVLSPVPYTFKVKVKRYRPSSTHNRATWRQLPYGITQCYLPPDTGECTPLNPSQKDWCSIKLPQRDGRLSWPRWLATYWDGSPAYKRSPIQVLTGPGVK